VEHERNNTLDSQQRKVSRRNSRYSVLMGKNLFQCKDCGFVGARERTSDCPACGISGRNLQAPGAQAAQSSGSFGGVSGHVGEFGRVQFGGVRDGRS